MKIFLTGGNGLVGRNILEHPSAKNHEIYAPGRSQVNLLDYARVVKAIEQFKPELVIHAAGLVGGIQANLDGLFDFLLDNTTMGLNVVKASKVLGVAKLINLGSTCMYPNQAPQPMKEEYLFTGPLEPTNEGYAVAKTTIQKACELAHRTQNVQYKTYIPCNLFGRWDHFDPEKSHLLPAIIRKGYLAKQRLETEKETTIEIWGDGTPKREFMDAHDLADFIFFSLDKFDEIPYVLNVSPGTDLTISEIYQKVMNVIFGDDVARVKFSYLPSKPGGMVRKLTDTTRLQKLGWKPPTPFDDTVKKAYDFYITHELDASKTSMTETKQKTALITGVTGQDGSHLSEFLLAKGYKVVGMQRRNSRKLNKWMGPIMSHPNFKLVYGNMQDSGSLFRIIEKYRPDEIYNLAGMSQVKISFECPEEAFDCIAMGTLKLLDAARALVPNARIYQAGSSEQFGANTECPQSEKTNFMPASPYAVAKVAAHHICVNYREAYKMFIATGILFNHEGPRRTTEFVTRKITNEAARIKLGLQDKLYLGNLEAKRDWGLASEYVEMMWLMLQHEKPEDFVIATGESHSVREFAQAVFTEAGLDFEKHIEFDPEQVRPQEVHFLRGDISKSEKVLGWKPKVKFDELAKIMYQEDLRLLKEELQNTEGRLE